MGKVFVLMHQYNETYDKRKVDLYLFTTIEKAKEKQVQLEKSKDVWETFYHEYTIFEKSIK